MKVTNETNSYFQQLIIKTRGGVICPTGGKLSRRNNLKGFLGRVLAGSLWDRIMLIGASVVTNVAVLFAVR